jgi:hypothetical protein
MHLTSKMFASFNLAIIEQEDKESGPQNNGTGDKDIAAPL